MTHEHEKYNELTGPWLSRLGVLGHLELPGVRQRHNLAKALGGTAAVHEVGEPLPDMSTGNVLLRSTHEMFTAIGTAKGTAGGDTAPQEAPQPEV